VIIRPDARLRSHGLRHGLVNSTWIFAFVTAPEDEMSETSISSPAAIA
jgi:hypothetical protein